MKTSKIILNTWAWLSVALLSIAGINWGLTGLGNIFGFSFNLVEFIFRMDWLINTVYVLVGIAGLGLLPTVLAMVLGKK